MVSAASKIVSGDLSADASVLTREALSAEIK